MARLFHLLLLLILGSSAFAQETAFQISGQILDDEKNPLEGAAVIIENTSIGAFTDTDGHYEIRSHLDSGTLIVRFIGYGEQSIPFDFGQQTHLALSPITLKASEEEIISCFFPSHSASSTTSQNLWPVAYDSYGSYLRKSLNTYSEQAVLNGQIPGLLVPQAEKPEAYFQSAYYGQMSQYMSNGMPLLPNSEMTNAVLWEMENQKIEILDPIDALSKSGVRAINGALNYHSSPFAFEDGLQYRNALGSNLQEHHLSYGMDHSLGRARLSMHRIKGRITPDWQMNGGSIANFLQHKSTSLTTELQAGQVVWDDSFGERQSEQVALLHNQLSHTFRRGLQFNLFHDTQWLKQSNTSSLDDQHNLKLETNYYLGLLRLEILAGGERFQSDYLQNTAYYGLLDFSPTGLFSLVAHARQEHITTPSASDIQATTYGGKAALRINDIACVPSRMNLSVASSRFQLSNNSAWLNKFDLNIPIRNHEISAQLTYNQYTGSESIDLGWFHWQQLGQQKSLGGSLIFKGSHKLKPNYSWIQYWVNYHYNQTQFNPFTLPIQGRRAYVGGQALAFQMPQILPKSLFTLGQEMNWKEWRFAFNLWAWLQNGESQIANGLNLQEVQLSWGHKFDQNSRWNQCRLYLHGQNLLRFSDQKHFAQLAFQTNQPALSQNPSLLLGMEISIF